MSERVAPALEEALRRWASWKYEIPLGDIAKVEMYDELDEGFRCCGGSDPGCYCSMETGASLNLFVTVWGTEGAAIRKDTIDMSFGDIAVLLKEIIEAKPKP